MKLSHKKISVVIPALNEELNIGRVLQRVKEAFEKYQLDGEIIVIEASSKDKTVEIASEAGAKVYTVPKVGLGYQYQRSLERITGDYIIMGDSDGTYDFMEMDRFIPLLDKGYDFVMGTRLKGDIKPGAMPWKNRYIGTPLLTFFINLFFNAGISDCNSGLRALTIDAFRKMKLESPGWEYASEMVVKGKLCRLKMTEVPVSLYPDQKGRKPHLTPWKAGWENMKYIWLLASEVIFIKMGIVIFGLGLLLLLSQLSGPITIGGTTFGTFYMFLGVIGTTIGFSIFQMGIITQSFSYLNQFRISPFNTWVKKHWNFEKGALGTILFGFVGSLLLFYVFIKRLFAKDIGFAEVNIVVYGIFFLTTGTQIGYFAFIYFLFNRYHTLGKIS